METTPFSMGIDKLKSVADYLFSGMRELIFPKVCVVCGVSLSVNEQHVCTVCLHERFENAFRLEALAGENVFLPQSVLGQFSLWKFDKNGILQDAFHNLKYEHLTEIGTDFGKAIARELTNHPKFSLILKEYPEKLLIPVPLHPSKRRIRGYNQAYYIAKGMSFVTKWPVVGKDEIKRIKKTKTQTGFNAKERIENIEKAFSVENRTVVNAKLCIIVDDVFTTGATTFGLAMELMASGAAGCIVATVAQA